MGTMITIVATGILLLALAGLLDDNKVIHRVSCAALVLSLLTIFVNPILW